MQDNANPCMTYNDTTRNDLLCLVDQNGYGESWVYPGQLFQNQHRYSRSQADALPSYDSLLCACINRWLNLMMNLSTEIYLFQVIWSKRTCLAKPGSRSPQWRKSRCNVLPRLALRRKCTKLPRVVGIENGMPPTGSFHCACPKTSCLDCWIAYWELSGLFLWSWLIFDMPRVWERYSTHWNKNIDKLIITLVTWVLILNPHQSNEQCFFLTPFPLQYYIVWNSAPLSSATSVLKDFGCCTTSWHPGGLSPC